MQIDPYISDYAEMATSKNIPEANARFSEIGITKHVICGSIPVLIFSDQNISIFTYLKICLI